MGAHRACDGNCTEAQRIGERFSAGWLANDQADLHCAATTSNPTCLSLTNPLASPLLPFVAAAVERCPYGITCRWASKHPRPDALTQQFLLDPQQQQRQLQAEEQQAPDGGEQAPAQQPAAAAGGAAMAEGDSAAPAVAPAAAPTAEQQGEEKEQNGQWWWRGDGTIPADTLELPPVGAGPPQEALNSLSKDLQMKLRWVGRSGRSGAKLFRVFE